MTVKRLVVIGNGFDLKCGLSSRFDDFFRYGEESSSEFNDFKAIVTELRDESIEETDIRSENGRVIWSESGSLVGNLNSARKVTLHEYTFWDYWFYIHQDGITNWTDVEKLVSDFFSESKVKESWADSVFHALNKLQDDVEKLKKERMWGGSSGIVMLSAANSRRNNDRMVQQLCFVLLHNRKLQEQISH